MRWQPGATTLTNHTSGWCAVAGGFPALVGSVKLVLVFFCGGGFARPCSDGFVLAGISCVFGYELRSWVFWLGLPCRLWVAHLQ